MKLIISSMICPLKFSIRKFSDRFIKSSNDLFWLGDELIDLNNTNSIANSKYSLSSSNTNTYNKRTMKFFIKVKQIRNTGKYFARIINSNFESIGDTGDVSCNNIETAVRICKDQADEKSIKIEAISLI